VRDDRAVRSGASGPINATGADNSIGFGNLNGEQAED
jgi:hypothetical protein